MSKICSLDPIEALNSAHVGSFGNSDRSSPAEWVPVIVVDAPDNSATADSSGGGSRSTYSNLIQMNQFLLNFLNYDQMRERGIERSLGGHVR